MNDACPDPEVCLHALQCPFSVGYELNFWSGVYGTVIGKLHLASPNKSETRLLWLFICVKSVNITVSDTHC